MSRGQFVVDLLESAEHRGLTSALVTQGFFNTDDTYQSVALRYDSFARRLPDAGGFIYYAKEVKSGPLTLGGVANDFAASDEFKAAISGKSNGQIVDFIYQNTLDRAADAEGKAFYTNQLDSGATAAGVLLDVALSQEHYNLFASHIVYGIDVL